MHRTMVVWLVALLLLGWSCSAPLSGAPTVPPRVPLSLSPKGSEKPDAGARKIDPKKSGTYQSGPWKYELKVRYPGTRSEGKWGRLFFRGNELSTTAVNDYHQTPWGPIYWIGDSQSRWGEHLWMPYPSPRHPDKKGKRLAPPGDGSQPLVVTKADNGRTVTVAVGATIHVRLAGNPTTGYRWRTAKLDGSAVKQEGKPAYEARQHPPGMVGVGGTYTFKFKAVKPGSAEVGLQYSRPWEKNKPPAETFRVKLAVKEKAPEGGQSEETPPAPDRAPQANPDS